MAVDGLIIPRSYNDYFSRTEITQFNNAVKATTDTELNPSSAFPVQNKAIAELVPTQASSTNKLADKEFVNSSVSTNTANYISDDGEPFQSVAALEAYAGTVTNNDYAFVTGTDSAGNTYYDRYKATINGASVSWAKEYRLNNSSFTAAQWAAIQSGITAAKVAQYDALGAPTPTVQSGNTNPVTSDGVYDYINNDMIHGQSSLGQAAPTDELIVYDVSANDSKKIQVQSLGNPNYSTTEQWTGGYWTDGKKIYRKCKTQQTYSGAGNNNIFDLGLNGVIDSLVSLKTVTKQSNGEQICDYYNSTSALQNCYLKTDGTVQFRAGSSFSYGQTTVIIEYTKVTD